MGLSDVLLLQEAAGHLQANGTLRRESWQMLVLFGAQPGSESELPPFHAKLLFPLGLPVVLPFFSWSPKALSEAAQSWKLQGLAACPR